MKCYSVVKISKVTFQEAWDVFFLNDWSLVIFKSLKELLFQLINDWIEVNGTSLNSRVVQNKTNCEQDKSNQTSVCLCHFGLNEVNLKQSLAFKYSKLGFIIQETKFAKKSKSIIKPFCLTISLLQLRCQKI